MHPLTLCVVSYPGDLEHLFERTAQHLARHSGHHLVVERCQHPEDLIFLAKLWKERSRSIVRLDLFGHGDGGRFKLGDGMLFASDGTGYAIARQLGPKLAADAEVRLLGCNTATEPLFRGFSGRKLMRDLNRLIGRQRRVVGTSGYLGPNDLGPRGLLESSEARLGLR